MKKTIMRFGVVLLCLWMLPLEAFAADYLIPVGQVIGLELRTDAVSVAALEDALGRADPSACAAQQERTGTEHYTPDHHGRTPVGGVSAAGCHRNWNGHLV